MHEVPRIYTHYIRIIYALYTQYIRIKYELSTYCACTVYA
jgi:hypothetical protein